MSNSSGSINEDFIKSHKWEIPQNLLSTEVLEPESETFEDFTIVWTNFNPAKGQNKETEQELKEMKQAIDEQINAGILKRTNKPQPSHIMKHPNALIQNILKGSDNSIRKKKPKIRPNDKCPCGSGKKYKKCHGK